ncbi:sugar fermentation stimulation protein [Thermosipho affectus]|uniref:Sugar fermentation stimulation protein homolog n=1 Tax=Thermosipho affectus TaxID=660294 RepID=A0ABX3IIL4_9BACT|nr:DNA/RNA nuclease SfsA [Thermosipho affectus]ONN27022.1 sugar fermentation stimulation protein [Thermosipho affectus]
MRIYKINGTEPAIFLKRVNKFVGVVHLQKEEYVHIHDPGRLKELLYEKNKVLIKREDKKGRKTKYDLIAAWSGKEFVLLNSKYHRYIAEKILRKKYKIVKPEVKVGNSRIDFFVDGNKFIEVKGCTLSKDGVAMFPDAPTKRGIRHIEELIMLKKMGYCAEIYFLVFSDAKYFSPNYKVDPVFSKRLKEAHRAGVEIVPLLFSFKDGWVIFKKEIPLKFD